MTSHKTHRKTFLNTGSKTLALFGAACLVATACDPEPEGVPVEHQTAALNAETNLTNATQNLTNATEFLTESDAIAETLSSLGSCEGDDGDSVSVPEVPPDPNDPNPVVVDPEPVDCAEQMKADLADFNDELDQAIADLTAELVNEVLVEANIESQSDTRIVYRLPVAYLCDVMGDVECEMDAESTQPRIRLTSPEDGDVDLALLVTANQYAPAVVHLHKDQIGMTVDLAEVQKAMAELEEEDDTIRNARGQIQMMLVKNGDLDYSFLVNVLSDIHLDVADEDGEGSIDLAATDRTYEIRLDGNAKTITASINLGTLKIEVPVDAINDVVDMMSADDVAMAQQMAEVVLGGLNGSFTFDGMTDILNFQNMGLGDESTRMSFDGQDVFTLDINKDAGRRFDMTVSGADGETPLFTFDPGFDAQLMLDFRPIEDQIDEPLPAAFQGDTIGFTLSGESPSMRFLDDGVQVVSGSLALTSANQPDANVTVTSGMCLLDAEAPVAGGHDLLSEVAAGACTQ